ncbi:MAG: nickel-responsive transcriptional regulator NikR [Sedimentisphaerales bacterium]|nr:nickel-responsive transcriptional regulator NikR [Sedimentisphaerales bacterium]
MEQLQRIGVSLEGALLERFDKLIERQGYTNRSEAIRDLIRDRLTEEKLADPNTRAVAAVMMVYDHHQSRLAQKLIELQHDHHLHTISSMHVHIDHHNCLEVVLLQGAVGEITRLGDRIVSLKGVKLGRVNLVATE